MKRKIFSIVFVLGIILSFGGIATQHAYAQGNTNTPDTEAPRSQAFTLDLKINNPLKVNTIQDAIRLGLNFVMRIAIPIIIVLLIWAGFQFIFAMGNKDKLTKAKQNFLYTLIGSALVLGAYTIAIAIINTINSLTQ